MGTIFERNKNFVARKKSNLAEKLKSLKQADKRIQEQNNKAQDLKGFLIAQEQENKGKREIVEKALQEVLPLMEAAKKDVRSINTSYLSRATISY